MPAPDHPKADADPSSGEQVVGEPMGPTDLEDLGQRIMREMDGTVEQLARIRTETSSALGEITKKVSGQLKLSSRQMEKLSAQLSGGQAHTECASRAHHCGRQPCRGDDGEDKTAGTQQAPGGSAKGSGVGGAEGGDRPDGGVFGRTRTPMSDERKSMRICRVPSEVHQCVNDGTQGQRP